MTIIDASVGEKNCICCWEFLSKQVVDSLGDTLSHVQGHTNKSGAFDSTVQDQVPGCCFPNPQAQLYCQLVWDNCVETEVYKQHPYIIVLFCRKLRDRWIVAYSKQCFLLRCQDCKGISLQTVWWKNCTLCFMTSCSKHIMMTGATGQESFRQDSDSQ